MSIDFDIKADLEEKDQRRFLRDISDFFGRYPRYVCDSPAKVIISRPTRDTNDDRVIADIRSESGNHLGSIMGEANGAGMLTFTPPNG